MGIIFRIVVPLSMSGIISVFVYAFMIAWNDVLFAFDLYRFAGSYDDTDRIELTV